MFNVQVTGFFMFHIVNFSRALAISGPDAMHHNIGALISRIFRVLV